MPPVKLLQLQHWFKAIVTQPLQQDNRIQKITPFGTSIIEEAKNYVRPSPFLEPWERIQIYHQQYWWRLLSCLQDHYPFVLRLFGYEDFNNKIGIPYLASNPPKCWALCELGESLPEWLEKHYLHEDQTLVGNAACMDRAAQRAFHIHNLPPINFSELTPDEMLTKKLFLQPHLHLFTFPLDFFSFREKFLEQPVEHWNDNPFPDVNYGNYFAAVYRNPKNQVSWKELSESEYKFLNYIKEWLTIEAVCAKIEEEGGLLAEEASVKMPLWFKEGIVLQWFGEK